MAIPADQQAHRDAFGRAFTAWMRINSWSQQNIHDAAADLSLQGPYNSQTSLLQRARLDPKPQFFVSLGQFNAAIEAQDLAAITRRNLKDRMTDAQPFITADDSIATAVDFFAMFIGAQPINQLYVAHASYTDADAKGLSDMCREAFRDLAVDQLLTPVEAWDKLKPHCKGMSAAEITKFREVLAGWADWNADEANALSVIGHLGKPAQALAAMGATDVSH